MFIKTLTVGPAATCCYLVSQEGREDCLVIDPGAEGDRILAGAEGKNISGILFTHGHFDHIGGAAALKGADTEVVIHGLDAPMLRDPALNASLSFGIPAVTGPEPTRTISEGEEIEIAGLRIQVLHTPGHTPGSVCYQIGNELFTGDTLFEHGWGRTDLPGGDEQALMNSLRRVMRLAKGMPIHPGHDY